MAIKSAVAAAGVINLAVACGETGDEAYIARSVAMRAGVAGGMADVHPLQLNWRWR